jgi:hypothetical protein
VLGRGDPVAAGVVEEPAHVGESGAGGCADAECLGTPLGCLGEHGVGTGAGQHRPEPDVVDDVVLTPVCGGGHAARWPGVLIGPVAVGATGAVVMVTLIMSTLGLPLAGVGLLLAIDPILDMMRTATNVAARRWCR